MKAGAIVLLALGLTGCGAKADTIAFDRGAFGLCVGRYTHALEIACAKKKLSEADCGVLMETARVVSKQVVTPPAGAAIDMEQIMKFIGFAAKLAL